MEVYSKISKRARIVAAVIFFALLVGGGGYYYFQKPEQAGPRIVSGSACEQVQERLGDRVWDTYETCDEDSFSLSDRTVHFVVLEKSGYMTNEARSFLVDGGEISDFSPPAKFVSGSRGENPPLNLLGKACSSFDSTVDYLPGFQRDLREIGDEVQWVWLFRDFEPNNAPSSSGKEKVITGSCILDGEVVFENAYRAPFTLPWGTDIFGDITNLEVRVDPKPTGDARAILERNISLCESNGCTNYLARLNRQPEACYGKIDSLDYADVCCEEATASQLPLDERTDWFRERVDRFGKDRDSTEELSCSVYSGESGLRWCDRRMESFCTKYVAGNIENEQAEEDIQEAIRTGDESICTDRLRSWRRTKCLTGIAVAKKDPAICVALSSSKDQDSCYVELALAMEDAALCEKMENPIYNVQTVSYRREICREQVRYDGTIPEQERKYENALYDFSFSYPWPSIEYISDLPYPDRAIFRKEGDFARSAEINVEITPFDEQYDSLEHFVDEIVKEELAAKPLGRVTLKEKRQLEISGSQAYEVALDASDDMVWKIVYIFNGGRLYEIRLKAAASAADVFVRAYDQIIETFTLEPIVVSWTPWAFPQTGLAPGFEFERTISFSSNRIIQQAKIVLTELPREGDSQPSGALPFSQLVAIQPETFDVIEPGKSYDIMLRFSVPDIHPTGIYYTGQLAVQEESIALGSPFNIGLILESSFSNTPDDTRIVQDPAGGSYPVNQVLLNFAEDVTRQEAVAFIESIPGKVIGFVESIDSYAVETDAQTIEELNRIIEDIRSRDGSGVEGVSRNALMQLF